MSKQLVDAYNRTIDYLRVSITDLCNLRCVYCRPPEGVKLVTHDDILRYEEILTIIELARDLGVRKIRVTGGEPLVRRGVVDFLRRLATMEGIDDIGLTTNGTRLPEMAPQLRAAGLTRINISLDSMRREVFKAITGFDALERVLEGIRLSMKVGLSPVKINVVLLKGINEADVPDFAELTLKYPIDVRFIERMPFGTEDAPNAPDSFSALEALDIIRSRWGNLEALDRREMDGPASMFKIPGALGRIGVIDPITGHFCGACNRLRLTARGTLRPCLLSSNEIDIKSALRSGASKDELTQIILKAVGSKPIGRPIERPGLCDGMNLIGG